MLRVAAKSISLLLGIAFLQGVPFDGHAAETCDYGTDPNNGLVLFSGTMPVNTEGVPHIGAPLFFNYGYNRAGATFLTKKFVTLNRISMMQSVSSDFSDTFGRIFILRLPAGDYEFQDWSYQGFGRPGASRALGVKPIKFTVEAQRIVYVGNFYPNMFEAKNLLGQTVIDPWLTIRDQSTRDLTVFRTKCPNFDVTQIDVKVMDPTPWIVRQKRP